MSTSTKSTSHSSFLSIISTCFALVLFLAVSGCGDGAETEPTAELETDVTQDTLGTMQQNAEPTDNEYGAFGDWDTDTNNEITETEFNEGFGEYGNFEDWDADASGTLDETEFTEGIFDNWDTDGDGTFTENDWNTWSENWFGDNADYGTFDDWDADANNELTATEFEEGFNQYGNYGEWDANADNEVGETEFNEGIFGLWDENASGTLEEQEWNDATDWWYTF